MATCLRFLLSAIFLATLSHESAAKSPALGPPVFGARVVGEVDDVELKFFLETTALLLDDICTATKVRDCAITHSIILFVIADGAVKNGTIETDFLTYLPPAQADFFADQDIKNPGCYIDEFSDQAGQRIIWVVSDTSKAGPQDTVKCILVSFGVAASMNPISLVDLSNGEIFQSLTDIK